ncbi:hypothetical protein DTO271D3_7385 [Paecilomyces variotii]|nr:hypothetical protein DTO271D3_7385 [Paecilomyces variotii]
MSADQQLGDVGTTQQSGSATQLNRSCESCRGLKVRCLPNPETPTQCQRCARTKRACIFVAPQKRRPRKRTDSRVAQLEREMRAMRVLLKDKHLPVGEGSQDEYDEGEERKEGTDEVDFGAQAGMSVRNMHPAQGSGMVPPRTTDYSPVSTHPPGSASGASIGALSLPNAQSSHSSDLTANEDVVDRGIIAMETASELLYLFIKDLAPLFPVVVLPTDTNVSQLRRSKPVLFLSVLAAAAIAVDAKLAEILNREIVRLYAERFFVEAEKSFELVQSLLIMIVFSYPPNSPLKIQIYQYTHIAATMALEIGLASKKRVPKKPTSGRTGRDLHDIFDEHMAEQARAILGCYHLCSQIGMRTRRPNMLLYNDWVKECVNHLADSPHIIDRRMATWFELQKMVDEAMTSFGLDDTSSTAPLTESRVQAVLRWFDNRMQDWKKTTPPDLLTLPLMVEYHHTNLAVYELAIGEAYRDPDAIKRQHYTLPPPDEEGSGQQQNAPLSAIRIDMTMKWLNAARSILDVFLGCDADTMRKMPNLMYTRIVLGLMTLMKIYYSVRSGALGEVIEPSSVNLDVYLEEMTRRLTEASGGQKYKIPSRWLFVVGVKARDWYDRFQHRQSQKEAGLQIQQKVSVQQSIPTNQYSMPMQSNSQFDPTVTQQTAAFNVQPMMQPLLPENTRSFNAHIPTTIPWPLPDDSYVTLSHPPAYLPGVMAPPMTFASSNPLPTFSQNQPFFSAGSGMEIDGWIPDGGIFGGPSLPGF